MTATREKKSLVVDLGRRHQRAVDDVDESADKWWIYEQVGRDTNVPTSRSRHAASCTYALQAVCSLFLQRHVRGHPLVVVTRHAAERWVSIVFLRFSEDLYMRWKHEDTHTIRPTEARLHVPVIDKAHGHLGLHSPVRATA
jgi:hypothetical protein